MDHCAKLVDLQSPRSVCSHCHWWYVGHGHLLKAADCSAVESCGRAKYVSCCHIQDLDVLKGGREKLVDLQNSKLGHELCQWYRLGHGYLVTAKDCSALERCSKAKCILSKTRMYPQMPVRTVPSWWTFSIQDQVVAVGVT